MPLTHQRAAITDLTSALPIERCDVEHHLHGIAGRSRRRGLTVHHQRLHAAALLQLLVTAELRVVQT